MKTIKFDKFQLNVPENNSENYRFCGNAPKKVKDMVNLLNKKMAIVPARTVATMVSQEIHQQFKEIV